MYLKLDLNLYSLYDEILLFIWYVSWKTLFGRFEYSFAFWHNIYVKSRMEVIA